MAEQHTDALVKPDMGAVLSRTHVAHELHGFLLPIFEAISNAMDGIESRFGDRPGEKGQIRIAFSSPSDPRSLLIAVEDNGVGLDDRNYKSFKTPFSGYKLERRGRGFGRFIAFKVFSRIKYASRYLANEVEKTRSFRFDIRQEREFIFHDEQPEFTGTGLRVEYDQPLSEWHDLVRDIKASDVLEEIGKPFPSVFPISMATEHHDPV